MKGGRTVLRAGSASMLLLTLGACGSPTALSRPRLEDYPPIKTVALEGSFRLEPLAAKRFDFVVPGPDPTRHVHLFATIDWTSPSNNVVASFAGEGCAGVNAALAYRCSIERIGTLPSLCPAKPRVLTETVRTGAAVSLWVANTGTSSESGRVQVVACWDAPGCEEGEACFQCSSERQQVDSCRNR